MRRRQWRTGLFPGSPRVGSRSGKSVSERRLEIELMEDQPAEARCCEERVARFRLSKGCMDIGAVRILSCQRLQYAWPQSSKPARLVHTQHRLNPIARMERACGCEHSRNQGRCWALSNR